MDKSFEGLLFSVVLHAILVWILLFGKFPEYHPSVGDKTEVTLVERENPRARALVTQTAPKHEVKLEDLKNPADFLSQFTNRVKKQFVAARNGPTVNAAPKAMANNQALKAGGQVVPQHQEEDGEGQRERQLGQQEVRHMAVGQSAISEYIPGVEAGAMTSLNTDESTYYIFFERMKEQVYNRWVSMIRGYMDSLTTADMQRLSQHERQTFIEIILSPEGQFERATIHSSSGEKRLDQIPGNAFQLAAPFPNPPRGLIEQDGLIHLKYAFVLQFRPPTFGPTTN